jgi:hypothetical protein
MERGKSGKLYGKQEFNRRSTYLVGKWRMIAYPHGKINIEEHLRMMGFVPCMDRKLRTTTMLLSDALRALRYAMRKLWSLPDESMFEYTR